LGKGLGDEALLEGQMVDLHGGSLEDELNRTEALVESGSQPSEDSKQPLPMTDEQVALNHSASISNATPTYDPAKIVKSFEQLLCLSPFVVNSNIRDYVTPSSQTTASSTSPTSQTTSSLHPSPPTPVSTIESMPVGQVVPRYDSGSIPKWITLINDSQLGTFVDSSDNNLWHSGGSQFI